MTRNNRFPHLMRAFFYEWLVEQRNASIHTVRSYRDAWLWRDNLREKMRQSG